MRFQGVLLLAGLLASAVALAHGGDDHGPVPGSADTQPAELAQVITVVPDSQSLVAVLALTDDTAARLRQMLTDYQLQQAHMLARYDAADGAERTRIAWLLKQAVRHQRQQLTALLTPEQEQAFYAFVKTSSDKTSSAPTSH